MKLIFYTIALFYLTIENVYAYLDPGSGSIIIQAILFVIAGFGTFFAFFKTKTKNALEKLLKKKDKKKKNDS